MVVYNQPTTKYRFKISQLENGQFTEMKTWCNDNIGSDNWTHKWNESGGLTTDYFYFNHEEDAMAFKLMWL